jgi:hypothetical protein
MKSVYWNVKRDVMAKAREGLEADFFGKASANNEYSPRRGVINRVQLGDWVWPRVFDPALEGIGIAPQEAMWEVIEHDVYSRMVSKEERWDVARQTILHKMRDDMREFFFLR